MTSAAPSLRPRKLVDLVVGTVSPSFLSKLQDRRELERAAAENVCLRARSSGRQNLSLDEDAEVRGHVDTMMSLDERIKETRSELERAGSNPAFGKLSRKLSSGATVAPIGFDQEELRRGYERLTAGEGIRLEARAFGSVSTQLPAELAPWITGIQHEGRILDHIPGYALDAPSIEIIQVNSVTGTAQIVAEGTPKPEIVPVVTPLTVTAQKIAAHVGLSYEALADFDAFSNYVRIELQQQIIQSENHLLLYDTGAAGHIHGFFTTPGILTFDASTADQGIDAIEQAIAALRVGPSLATPDLIVLNPSDWSGIRRTKDTLGRYLLSADPSDGEADSIWGITVVPTTACATGDGLLVDTSKFGRALVREPLSLRIGWSGTDFVDNILRTVGEERLNLGVERPTAVLHLTGLTAGTTTATKTAAKK